MNRKKQWIGLFTAAVITAGAVAVPSLYHSSQYARAEQQVEASREQLANVQDLATVYKAVGRAVEPSVVSIEVKKKVAGAARRFSPDMLRRFFQDQQNGGKNDNAPQDQADGNDPQDQQQPDNQPEMEQQGTGSGVIMDFDSKTGTAYILTNNHVAGDATEMTVTLWDGRSISDAKLVGADPKSDLAVVKITADSLIPAKWGDSDVLEKGDLIMAFGSPFGYVGSMTHGIVSALHRQAMVNHNSFAYENFIQVDAPINPGNSGGALVNLKGEVVGINTAIATESGGFQGIGFAIPSNQAKYVYDSIKSKGKVVRGWLGVKIDDVTNLSPEFVNSLGYKDRHGVFVSGLMNKTPASNHLVDGDIITALDGKAMGDRNTLRDQIARTAPGTEITLSVFRDGKMQDVKIKLGEQPEEMGAVAAGNGGGRRGGGGNNKSSSVDSLGIIVTNITDNLTNKFGLDANTAGVVVLNVRPGSPGQMQGLRAGDVITRVGKSEVHSVDELNDAVSKGDLSKGIQIRWTNAEGSQLGFFKNK